MIDIQDTTYAGEAASPFIVRAMTGADTIQGGHLYVKDGIKKKFTIPRISVSDIIQDRAATPVSRGTITVDGKTLEPNDYMIYTKFNPRDFEDHWYADQLEGGLLDRRLPQTIESAIIQEFLKIHDNYLETAIWQSKVTNTNTYKYWDGIIYKALQNADVIDIASPVTLTAANIEAKFQAVMDAITASVPALLYDPQLKFYVSYKTAQLWERAQASATYKGVDNTQMGLMKFQGRTIVPLAGVPDDTIFACKGMATKGSNLWLGYDSAEAENTVEVAKWRPESELYYIKMLFKADVQIGFGQEVVMYTTATY